MCHKVKVKNYNPCIAVDINEILSGEHLSEMEYKEKAEENIKTVLKKSSFSVKEKVSFFKRKWFKERYGETYAYFMYWR